MPQPLIRVSSPYFVAGVVVQTGDCAPIIGYMRYWPLNRIIDYCKSKRWTVEIL